MDVLRLKPSDFVSFSGEIQLEKSKSIANRALLLQALSFFSFSIDDVGKSDDVLIMKEALLSSNSMVNVGMAGTALRFLTAGYSVLPGKRVVDGHPRLKDRPIVPLLDALKVLGAKISFPSIDDKLPFEIEGGFVKGNEVDIEQLLSSQFISALMMIGPFLPNGLRIKRKENRTSDSYVLLTKRILEDMGLVVELTQDEIYLPSKLPTIKSYIIESDWSAAGYWMAFAVLVPESNIILKGLREDSAQGDKEMLTILKRFGLHYKWDDEKLILSRNTEFSMPESFQYDCSEIPDQAQTLAFLCATLGIEAKLTGLETLFHKETDRIDALKREIEKLGYNVETANDFLSFSGELTVDNTHLSTYKDHRMAMAGALLACRIKVEIENPKVVSKSYPSFWDDLEMLTNASATEK